MNLKLLRKVQKAILAEPEHFDMDSWFRGCGVGDTCGTAACISGHALVCAYVAKRKNKSLALAVRHFSKLEERGVDTDDYVDFETMGRDALNLTPDQANRLFFTGEWPIKYMEAYEQAETAACRAKAASQRIDHFIETKGRE